MARARFSDEEINLSVIRYLAEARDDTYAEHDRAFLSRCLMNMTRIAGTYMSTPHLISLSAVFSVNVVLYSCGRDRGGSDVWRRSTVILRDRSFPTVVPLFDGVDHYRSVEWGFGDPKVFFL